MTPESSATTALHMSRQAQQWLAGQIGQEALDRALRRFVEDFPPPAVYKQEVAPAAYLAGETDGVPHREAATGVGALHRLG